MKKIMYFLIMFLTVNSASALVIDQVYYDPIGTESGGEFIVLRNDENIPINLEGYVIATGSSSTDVVLPSVVLSPGSKYLIADTGWDDDKDDDSWPSADLEDTITLKNSDSGVAIVFNGTIIDAVGWGNAPSGLHEGTPFVDVGAGEALIRINDTDDNSVDFVNGTPVFGVDNGGNIPVNVVIMEPIAEILEITFLADDDVLEGVQLLPSPGVVRDVNVRVMIGSSQNVTTTAYLSELVNLGYVGSNGTVQEFQGAVPLYHYQRPGKYNVTITADDGNDVAVSKVEIEILSLVALDVDVQELNFGALLPGSVKRLENKSLNNIGNVDLDLQYEGTHLQAGPFSINISSLHFSVDKDFAPGLTKEITPDSQVLGQSIDTLASMPLGFELHVPEDAIGGTYSGTVTLTGVSR